jgi:hypothetical protein
MNARSYFLSLSSSVIIINIIIGLCAIFLVERILPAIDSILEENAYSVSTSLSLLENISASESEDFNFEKSQAAFWVNLEKAKKNLTVDSEPEIINKIDFSAQKFWGGDKTAKIELTNYISELATVNLQAMKDKEKKAQFMSLTGAWGLGLLLLISVGIQLIQRTKILNGLITPQEHILWVLKDFNSGNFLRRFVEQKDNLTEIKQTGVLINSILDKVQPTSSPNKK